jgi:hypothetical protein
VDDRTGTITIGPDGIPENVLKIGAAPSSSRLLAASLVMFHPRPEDAADLERTIEKGCDSNDLEALGGELSFGSGPPALPALELDRDVQSINAVESLLRIRGEKRIWLLSDRPDASARCSLSGFVAGRVVACSLTNDAGIEIVVQPCQLVTCTAMVAAGWPHNPWLGKVMLSE